ncbi:MAG TPA: hypothetical protein PK228_04040 [Saprospiraceae bacterium]|nr:hypothetical protein [Saprospiraceae bacterium]
MKTHFSKVTFLFALYAALHVAEACKKEMACDCPVTLPHFDYKSLTVEANIPVTSSLLKLTINADSVEYLASAPVRNDFSIISTAWACDCAWNGYDGAKYDIQSLNIYADRDFNDTLPEGASLNPIFFQLGGDYLVLMSMPGYQPINFNASEAGIYALSVSTSEKPDTLNVPYRFRVELIKSTGDTLTAETGDVYFQ